MENPYRITLGIGKSNADGLWYPRMRIEDPGGEVILNAHIPNGYSDRAAAERRLRAAIPDILQHLRLSDAKVEMLEVV